MILIFLMNSLKDWLFCKVSMLEFKGYQYDIPIGSRSKSKDRRGPKGGSTSMGPLREQEVQGRGVSLGIPGTPGVRGQCL